MKIIVINGVPRSGKDQFVSFCQNQTYWCKNISTVDFVKAVAQYCGWDGTKTPENRAFLAALKDLLTKWNDVPYKHIEESIERFCSHSVNKFLYFFWFSTMYKNNNIIG